MEPTGAPWRVLEPSEPEAPAARPDPRGIPWLAVAGALIVAAAALGAYLLAARSDPVIGVDGATGMETGYADSAGPSADPATLDAAALIVEVGGAVARPGVYRLPAGARVGDAIEAAGGYGPSVDAGAADRQLNLASPLRDGDEVHVPVRGETAASGSSAGSGDNAGRLVDVNTASAEALDSLPGIGPATAAKIIAARQERRFASVDDLRTRRIVGEATLEKIRALVTVSP